MYWLGIMLSFRRIVVLLAVVASGLSPKAAAQRIVSLNIDRTHCINDSLIISIGYATERNVVVENPPRSISHPQCTFLPDGVVCDSTVGTCTYRSPVTFTAYNRGAVVTSAQDIDFVRLKIEHTWMADIFIALECPNGQFASLMNAMQEPKGCGDAKFDSLVGWNYDYGTVSASTHLGLSNRDDHLPYCDTSSNPPGEGWNYCWSENNSHQYAPKDGLIYRYENRIINVMGNTIDSTHIAADTHFYRPQQSFDSLIGCPLNGTWNIVVQDSWGCDNGYVFDWELSLLAIEQYIVPHVDTVEWGGASDTWNAMTDTTFLLVPPATDTTISYALRVALSSGDTVDTAFSIHWVEPYFETVTDTLCIGDTARWNNLFFTADTLHLIRDTTYLGCDSVVDLSYTFMPTYNLHDTLSYCANEPFMYEGIDYGGPTTIVVPHLTQYGCDSTVTAHLVVIDSAFRLQLQMSTDGVVWSADTVLHGCLPMTVLFRDTTLFEQWRQWSFGDGDTLSQIVSGFRWTIPITHIYDSVGVYSLMLKAVSIHGCVDSLILREDAVQVHSSPEAAFYWSPTEIVSHDPQTQFINLSIPMDSLNFLWNISTGEGGVDTTSAVAPHYQWTNGSGDMDVTLFAFWPHVIDSSMTLVCVDSMTHTVTIVEEYLRFPNLVTPNGDGINDCWVVDNLLECGLYSMNELWIYNSWGVLVYHVRDIRHQEDFWDPSGLPDGTYYFLFRAISDYGLVKHNGVIEVIR